MTISEFTKIDIRKLSDKARTFFEQSDQGIYEFFKDTDKDDIDSINEIAENLSEEVFE